MSVDAIISELRSLGSPSAANAQRRFGITTRNEHLGVAMPAFRKLAKRIGTDHKLAQKLWASRVHDARILAGMIADPHKATPAMMQRWVKGFDSWDICDQVCLKLFCHTPHAWDKTVQWATCEGEFIKRAGFTMMACLAVHDKKAANIAFTPLLDLIEGASDDDRNFVRKAVNWALRGIGKRNSVLNRRAIAHAKRIATRDTRAARWIAADALRELQSDAVQTRLARL